MVLNQGLGKGIKDPDDSLVRFDHMSTIMNVLFLILMGQNFSIVVNYLMNMSYLQKITT